MNHRLQAEIEINASPETVWSILTDLEHYPDWNPFVVSASGTVAVGERLENRLQPPGRKPRTFKPTVTSVEPGQTFEWLGRVGFRGIFDGRHRFELRPTRAGTHLTQIEEFSGVLVRVMRRALDTETLQGFHDMNAALKRRAEAHVSAEP
jgi:hypothetical protein